VKYTPRCLYHHHLLMPHPLTQHTIHQHNTLYTSYTLYTILHSQEMEEMLQDEALLNPESHKPVMRYLVQLVGVVFSKNLCLCMYVCA